MGKDYSIAQPIGLSPEKSKRRKYTVAEARSVSISFTNILLRWTPWEEAVLITQNGLTFRSVVSEKNNQRGQAISQIIVMFVVPLSQSYAALRLFRWNEEASTGITRKPYLFYPSTSVNMKWLTVCIDQIWMPWSRHELDLSYGPLCSDPCSSCDHEVTCFFTFRHAEYKYNTL